MNDDFWKKFPPIPGFDCLKMKEEIQSKIYEQTKDMTQEQRLEFYRSGAKKLRRSRRSKSEPATLKEETTPYQANPRRKK